MFNVLVHFFRDCSGYPSDISLRSRDKLTTTAVHEATCPDCRRRLESATAVTTKVG